MEKVITPKGLKLYVDKIHVKTIPAKYEDIVTERDILNWKRKWLTNEERWLL